MQKRALSPERIAGIRLVPRLLHSLRSAAAQHVPSDATILRALKFVAKLKAVPFPSLASAYKGAIVLEWRNGDSRVELFFPRLQAPPELHMTDGKDIRYASTDSTYRVHPEDVPEAIELVGATPPFTTASSFVSASRAFAFSRVPS